MSPKPESEVLAAPNPINRDEPSYHRHVATAKRKELERKLAAARGALANLLPSETSKAPSLQHAIDALLPQVAEAKRYETEVGAR